MCISRLEMYISRLEMCISRLEIEFIPRIGNFFSGFRKVFPYFSRLSCVSLQNKFLYL